ncbi:MAG: aryl-sulfate sulfotransferase, partial [Myxococcales bacterium]|nr:aryl-sulfate sulfotransferase [Myxococcales bacterium]
MKRQVGVNFFFLFFASVLAAGPAFAASAGMAVAELGLARVETGSIDEAQMLLVAAIRAAVSPSPGQGPTIYGPQVIDAGGNVLVKLVGFATDVEALPRVRVQGGGRTWWVPRTGFLTDGPATAHGAIIAGMKADTEYTVTMSALDPQSLIEGSKATIKIKTDPLPPGFPPIRVAVNKHEKRTPGVILFDVTGQSAAPEHSPAWLVIVDEDGDPIWYYNNYYFLTDATDVRRISNGNLLFIGFDGVSSTAAREINLFGAELRQWSLQDLQIHSMHHELAELPNGNFMVLSSLLHFYDDYPPFLYDVAFGAEHYVVTDAVVMFTPEGKITYFYDLVDSLDHLRVLPGFEDTGFWAFTYGPGVNDWGHGNGVVIDPKDGNLVISLRHQDIVFKMTLDGRLVWVLGQHHFTSGKDLTWPFLQLEGPGRLPEHQHAPEILPNGNLLLYDNSSTINTHVSRPVEYEIDEETLTARQVWEWIDPDYDPPIFSIALSDADLISETNVLVDDGAVERARTTPITLAGAWTRIAEVNKVTNEKVFELIVRDDAEEDP